MTNFKEYFTEQIKNFNEYHSNLLISVTKNDIHKLRTALKKLRTCNNLLDSFLLEERHFPTELYKLFKSTGEIRDIHIQQGILDGYVDPYRVHLYIQSDKFSKFNIKEDFQEELQYLINKLNKIEDYKIYDQIVENIRNRISFFYDDVREMIKNVSPENLHEIRKKIKKIYYTFLLLGEDKDEKLYNIQETIGLWHDYDMTIENILKYDSNSKIIDSLSEKRDLYYNESLELIKDL